MKPVAVVKVEDVMIARVRRARDVPAKLYTMRLACGCEAPSLQRTAHLDAEGARVYYPPARMKCPEHGW